MRIVAGAAKGRKLAVPARGVRPTPDRVREALFSSLADRVVAASVLDLFAGSGALGLEAWSRGAANVTFVEHDPAVQKTLQQNIATVGCGSSRVVKGSADRFLAQQPQDAYTLVFLDPPYALPTGDVEVLLARLQPHLAAGATVVVEREKTATAPTFPPGYSQVVAKRYGNVQLYRATWQNDASVTAVRNPVETS